MNEYMIELLSDALHLSHDQEQMSDEDYQAALDFVMGNFQSVFEHGWDCALSWVSAGMTVGATQSSPKAVTDTDGTPGP